MNEGEKCETMSGTRLHSFTSGMIEQLEQPQLIRFSFREGSCLVDRKVGKM